METLRILLSSNSHHCGTGYGTQSKVLLDILKELGHDTGMFAWYGLSGGIIQAGDTIMYPRIQHAYGGDAKIPALHFKADLLITLNDIWVLPDDFAESLPCPWASWFPIDGDPLSPPIKKQVEKATYPIVFSKYACEVLNHAGIDNYTYIPHSLDSNVFYPLQDSIRSKHGIPDDCFLVGMVAANKGYPSRKSFPEAFLAFSKFKHANPGKDIRMYVHSMINAPGVGLDLADVARLTGLTIGKDLLFPNQADLALGLPESYLHEIYNMLDVLFVPSMGEGFGLPIVESQMSGTPVITTACTSMQELTINGISVPPLQPAYSPLGAFQYVADIEANTSALQHMLDNQNIFKLGSDLNEKALGHFSLHYSKEVCKEKYWKPFLEHVIQDLKPHPGRVKSKPTNRSGWKTRDDK